MEDTTLVYRPANVSKSFRQGEILSDIRRHRIDPATVALDELAIDFKRYFAVPTDELYALLDANRVRRRCVLNHPYMQHLCQRFGSYLGRVALPRLPTLQVVNSVVCVDFTACTACLNRK